MSTKSQISSCSGTSSGGSLRSKRKERPSPEKENIGKLTKVTHPSVQIPKIVVDSPGGTCDVYESVEPAAGRSAIYEIEDNTARPSLEEELRELGIEPISILDIAESQSDRTQPRDIHKEFESTEPSSVASRSSLGAGGIAECARQASRAVQEAKTALESRAAGNLKKEVRELVVDRMQYILELVYRLSDSRSRLAVELERTRTREAKSQDVLSKKHAKSLEIVMKNYKIIEEKIENTHSEIKAVRLIVDSEITRPIEKIQKDIGNISKKDSTSNESSTEELRELTKEVAALRAECRQEGRPSYAEVSKRPSHTLIITAKDQRLTADQVVEKVATTLMPRETGLNIDRCRKAKDGKVVISCRDKKEGVKVAECLRKGEFTVNEATPKNPLIEMRFLLSYHKDEEVIDSIWKQNPRIVNGLKREENTTQVRYRRRARNPHETHMIMEVSPRLWKKITEEGYLYVGMQRVKVLDRSPLIQCMQCLGYGHTRKTCSLDSDHCAYCGGTHTRENCEKFKEGAPPKCINCTKEKRPEEKSMHVAFNEECPVRKKWDALARSRVAYC